MSIRRTIEGDFLILENTENGDRVEIRETITDGSVLIAPNGRLDTEMVHDLEDELTSMALMCSNVILDMGHVQYLSNSVIRMFLELQHMVDSRRGTMSIIGVKDAVWNRFEELGLEEVFFIERDDTVNEVQRSSI